MESKSRGKDEDGLENYSDNWRKKQMKDALIGFIGTILMGFIGLNLWGVIGGSAIAEAGAVVFAIATACGFIIYNIDVRRKN